MLTVYQTDIMALLTDFKCLRHSHILRYMMAKHNTSEEQLDKMLSQLCFMGKLKISGGYVSLPGRKTDFGIIRAFDVVMDLTDGHLEYLYPGTDPFILVFSVKPSSGELVGKPVGNNIGVILVDNGHENSICSRLNRLYVSDREFTVIFVLEGIDQQRLIGTDNKHYFAVPDENGKYKFFKAANRPLI